jgi:hypothetical protein
MALTDSTFQSYLNSVPGENNRTLWEQIKDLLSNLLNAMGLDINPNSILATAIKDSMDVIEASQPVKAGPVSTTIDTYKYFGAVYNITLENGVPVDVNIKRGDSETNIKFQERKNKILAAYKANPNVDPQNGKSFRSTAQPSTSISTVKVISEDYGVVQAETNPSQAKKQEFLNLIKPQIQSQTYKENVGKGANQMFHYGKMWSRVTAKAKPLKINSFAPTQDRDKLIDAGENAKGNKLKVSEYTYAYHELDQNGNPLPPISTLQPIIDEIQNTLGIDMSNYDSVIGNIYQPNEFIYPHKDVTESKSAEGYPVIVYTMGANAGLGIVDNNKGKMTFANQYDDRYLRGDEKLKGYTNEVLTKDGTIYTFGLNGKGRFQLTHSTPINDAKVGSQLPITLPNGKVITNYTITLTFRRAADLEPGMPTAPAKIPTQPTTQPVEAATNFKIGQYVSYNKNGDVYIVTKALEGNKYQIYNPNKEGAAAKLQVSADNILPYKALFAKIVEYNPGENYIVTSAGTIISLTSNKKMNFLPNDGRRVKILALASGATSTSTMSYETMTPEDQWLQYGNKLIEKYGPGIKDVWTEKDQDFRNHKIKCL